MNITESDGKITALNGKEKICLFLNVIPKLNVAEINSHMQELGKMNVMHGILIHEEKPTPPVKQVVANAISINICIELFSANDLQFNITKHRLVPQHVKMSSEECRILKKKYGSNLPILIRSDPISRFYNFQKGDIVKIVRADGDLSVPFRIVK